MPYPVNAAVMKLPVPAVGKGPLPPPHPQQSPPHLNNSIQHSNFYATLNYGASRRVYLSDGNFWLEAHQKMSPFSIKFGVGGWYMGFSTRPYRMVPHFKDNGERIRIVQTLSKSLRLPVV